MSFLANVAHGPRAAGYYLGDLRRAISYGKEAARLLPDAEPWLQLTRFYDRARRNEDAIGSA